MLNVVSKRVEDKTGALGTREDLGWREGNVFQVGDTTWKKEQK